MKLLKRFLLLPACVAAIACSALGTGCNNQTNKTYTFYTNIPQGGYEIIDDAYLFGGTIAGYSPEEKENGEEDTSAYTAKGRTFPSVLFTEAQVVVYSDFTTDAAVNKYDEFVKTVKSTLDAISKAVSTTVADSDIYRFNAAAAGATVKISQTTYEILTEAKAAYEFTEHYYNPALYYNVLAYGFGSAADYPDTAAELPDDGVIEQYKALASHFGEIDVRKASEGYFVTKPDYTEEVNGEILSMKLDLGGIAKGYAVDLVDGLFDEYEYQFGYFSFGSSSMLVKRHFTSGTFNLEFIGPRSLTRQGYFKLRLADQKLSTSGDNEQAYFIDGTRYCHVIDPTTGKPVQTGIMSATVIGGSAASSDAITTAIMAMGKDKAISFIEEKLTDRMVAFTCE